MKIFLSFLLIISFNATEVSAAGFGDLFKSPYKRSAPTSQGNAGPTVASLSRKCQAMRSSPLMALSQVYMPHIWPETTPVIPFVGIVTGLTQHNSILFRICDVLLQMDQIGFRKSILNTGRFLNELTGNQFDAEYQLFDSFHNFANSVYDFDKGNTRPGALQNANNHRRLVNLADQSVKYYNTRITERGAEQGLETKAQRRVKLQEISRLSYQRAILSEASKCPAPAGTTDFQKKYNAYVPPREAKLKYAQQEIDYFYQQMLRMGQEFNVELNDMQDYSNRLKQLVFNSTRYITRVGYHEKESAIVTNRRDRQGKPVKRMKTEKKRVNTFSVFVDQQVVTGFRSKYVDKWESWVNSQLLTSGTRGLLDGKKGRIEAKFRHYSFECSEVRLGVQIAPNDKSDPLYRLNLDRARRKCMDQLIVRDSQAKNLLDEYINRLLQALNRKYKNQAEIWNFEAIELGYNRAIREKVRPEKPTKADLNFQEMEVACSESLSTAETRQVGIKNSQVNTALKEEWLKDEFQRTEKLNIRERMNSEGMKKVEEQQEKELTKSSSKVTPSSPPLNLKPGGI